MNKLVQDSMNNLDALNEGHCQEYQHRAGADRAEGRTGRLGGNLRPGHYLKKHDLNEATPGISLAVIPRPGALCELYDKGVATDLPEYAYYTESHRMVKLDTRRRSANSPGPARRIRLPVGGLVDAPGTAHGQLTPPAGGDPLARPGLPLPGRH